MTAKAGDKKYLFWKIIPGGKYYEEKSIGVTAKRMPGTGNAAGWHCVSRKCRSRRIGSGRKRKGVLSCL
jgi:hypothetical protein